MKRAALFLIFALPLTARAEISPEQAWTSAGASFDALGRSAAGLIRPASAQSAPELGAELSLGDLAQRISQNPDAVDAIVDALVKNAGRLGQAWDSPQRRAALEAALRRADKKFLDAFPILTPAQLLGAAKLYVSRMQPPPKEPIPPKQTLTLSGKPAKPKHDEFLKDLSNGLKYGDHADLAQTSAYGDSKELAQALNRLASNVPGAPAYTLEWDGTEYTTVSDFLTALEQNSVIELRDMRFYANFGDLFLDAGGKRNEIRTPLYTDTGHTLPSGRKLIVPVAHSHLAIRVRGRVNADMSFFFGVDGAADFRADATIDQRWVGGRVIRTIAGPDAKALLVRASWVRRELAEIALKFDLKAGGYGPLGECNGIHAFITGELASDP